MAGATRAVHPALRGLLAAPLVAYDIDVARDSVHLGIPSPTATVIVAFDDPLDVGWLSRPQRSNRLWTSISGLHLGPALIRTHGIQRGIQVALTPVGCRSLFGLPLSALMGESVDLTSVPRGLTSAEHDEMQAASSWPARLTLLELALLRRLEPDDLPDSLRQACQLLTSGHGVQETADQVGWSRRHLQTLIRAEVSVTPKQLGRIARLHRARALVASDRSLADAAHHAGYADQPHLSREWRLLCGRSPSAAGEAFPNLHDVLASLPPECES